METGNESVSVWNVIQLRIGNRCGMLYFFRIGFSFLRPASRFLSFCFNKHEAPNLTFTCIVIGHFDIKPNPQRVKKRRRKIKYKSNRSLNWFLGSHSPLNLFYFKKKFNDDLRKSKKSLLNRFLFRSQGETKINSIVTLGNSEQWINNEINSMLIF